MSKPPQMFDHVLDHLKGWPSPYALDKSADVADGETIIQGQVMSLDANANFVAGLVCGGVAVFALNGSSDFDVVGDDGNLVGGGTATARQSGLVALGPFELESTEYDTADTFAPNDVLTSPEPGQSNAGRIQLGVAFTDTICGVVSDGTLLNENRKSVIRFWPVWLPPLTCGEVSSS